METKEKDEFKVVGLDCRTSVQECGKVLPALWQDFMKRADEVKNKKDDKVHYGMCFAKKDCNFRYIACSEVSEFEKIPKGMKKEIIPAQKYAVFTHKGKIDKLGETYSKIMEEVKESGLKQDKIWFELYDNRYIPDSDKSEFDIWVSVK
jgi:predicted transcriptional regulator YdeE